MAHTSLSNVDPELRARRSSDPQPPWLANQSGPWPSPIAVYPEDHMDSMFRS